ncbi:efflux RND transporter periplasmic adaptor subunit [Cellvibrio mixtus]|uniref:efflux RND transporter periplasmic adaptor subunit n=1 Tax=Cellvibrio mixtus TaxID=39650 RepID=UPI00069438A4|nr:efflux RND transporter periplasmic adaptor subunit [Cellvibrio mixtus]
MNISFFVLPARRWLMAAAWVSLSITPTVALAARTSSIPISDQQIRNLGIETIQLDTTAASASGRYPAQIVLPPHQEYRLGAPDNSLVQQVLVLENQPVNIGDPLLVISSQNLGELSLALIENHSRWKLAQQNLERDQELLNEGIIPSRRLEESKANERDARAALAQARSALTAAGVDDKGIEGLIRQGKASNTLTLRAPVAGIVTGLIAKPGWRNNDGLPLLHLVKREQLWVDVQIPANQAGLWPSATLFQLADGTEATLLNLSPVTSAAQTRVLRGLIENPPAHLLPGSYQQALLPLSKDHTWDLPLSAIARRGAQAYVFVRTDTGFDALPIEVAASGGQRALVSGALQSGAEIAAVGVVALKAAWLSHLDSEPASAAVDNQAPETRLAGAR